MDGLFFPGKAADQIVLKAFDIGGEGEMKIGCYDPALHFLGAKLYQRRDPQGFKCVFHLAVRTEFIEKMDSRREGKPLASEILTIAAGFRGLFTDQDLESPFCQKGGTAESSHPRTYNDCIVWDLHVLVPHSRFCLLQKMQQEKRTENSIRLRK